MDSKKKKQRSKVILRETSGHDVLEGKVGKKIERTSFVEGTTAGNLSRRNDKR